MPKFVSVQYLENKWTDFTKSYICIHIDKIFVGIVTHNFSHISTRVMALDLRQNYISAHYLENKLGISLNFIYAFTLTKSTLG